jgi:hypothetical protein
LEFLNFLIKIQEELNEYNILKDILKDQLLLSSEQKKQFIENFINGFNVNELLNKEKIKLFEYLIFEFNYLENSLEYKVKKNENDKSNYEITKLKEDINKIKFIIF